MAPATNEEQRRWNYNWKYDFALLSHLRKPTIADDSNINIIWNAPFSAGFLEVILIFQMCQNAPFLARFWDMIKSTYIGKKVNISPSPLPINLTESGPYSSS